MSIVQNAIQEIQNKLGYAPTEIIFDGKNKRFGKKDNGYYYANEWEYKGNTYQTVNYGCWKLNEKFTWKSFSEKDSSSKGFQAAYKKQTEEAKIAVELETQKKNEECKAKWLPIFKAADNKIVHEYLKFKGISNQYISRVDHKNVLLIPAYDHNGFVGVQRIFNDPETGKPEKRFSSGIKKKGSFCPLTPFKNAEYIYLSEGYATASSIQEAFPDIPSLCAFDSGNLFHAINTIRFINPSCKIIIAADKDENGVGEKSAKKCSKSYADVIYKVVETDNVLVSDFNDLHNFLRPEHDNLLGFKEVQRQLKFSREDFTQLIYLGYFESDYFYSSTENNQIITISAGGHSNALNMLQLAPMEWWNRKFGFIDEQTKKVKVDWKNVASDMMAKCRDAGLFNPSKVRGRGVWKDGKNFVINNGETVYNENKDSCFHYQKLIKTDYSFNNPFSDSEMDLLNQGFQNLLYKNKKDYIYLAAWVIQAQIFGCLPWRFHVWVTGARGNGKSKILEWANELLPLSVLTNNATAAGIRQEVLNDASAVVVDENELDSGRVNQIIELSRQMSTNSKAKSLRGTSTGKGISLSTQAVFMFGSIQIGNLDTADVTRIFIVEMLPTKGQKIEDYEAISKIFEFYASNKHRIFARAYNSIGSILISYDLVKRYLHSKQLESRLGDQISMLVACFWVYLSTEPIPESSIEQIINHFNLINSDYVNDSSVSDSDNCMDEILSAQIDRDNKTVAFAIEYLQLSARDEKDLDYINRSLAFLGIRYMDDGTLFVASKSELLSSKMKKYPNYARILSRDKEVCVNTRDKQMIKGFKTYSVHGLRLKIKR
jgi:phage/plasmid primase-like uncharacterized protein